SATRALSASISCVQPRSARAARTWRGVIIHDHLQRQRGIHHENDYYSRLGAATRGKIGPWAGGRDRFAPRQPPRAHAHSPMRARVVLRRQWRREACRRGKPSKRKGRESANAPIRHHGLTTPCDRALSSIRSNRGTRRRPTAGGGEDRLPHPLKLSAWTHKFEWGVSWRLMSVLPLEAAEKRTSAKVRDAPTPGPCSATSRGRGTCQTAGLRPEHAIDKRTLGRMLEIMDRDDLKRLLGPFPVRCPLDAVLLETADCGLYIRETIEYAVETDERVKSFLLVPKHINRSVPAIFAHHQHASQFHLGKSEVVGLK